MAHVLIIDDDEHITRLLESHLTEEGHQVTVTHDGQDGLEQAEKTAPDLIMLDVFLPDATGYQMCNRLRKSETTKTTPIIMMTGAARFPNQQMYGRQRGANEYIFKPFNIVEVGELVHKYIKPAPTNGASKTPAAAPDNIVALHSFLQQASHHKVDLETVAPTPMSMPMETLDAFGQPTRKPAIPMSVETPTPLPSIPMVRSTPRPQPAAVPDAVEAVEPAKTEATREIETPSGEPVTIAEKERFIDLGMEIYALASRMTSTNAEIYLADQLLRSSLNAGARITEIAYAESRHDSLILLQQALKDLRETDYWLMLANKTRLLETLGKAELVKTCQTLITVLADLQTSEKKSK